MNRVLPGVFMVVGLGAFALAYGFFLEQEWALSVWPFPAKKLGHIFLSSIFAAIGAPILWMGISREWAAVAGGAINLAVTAFGLAWLGISSSFRQPAPKEHVLAFGIAMAMFMLACLVQWTVTRRLSFKDTRPIPKPVRASFSVFGVLLTCLGAILITQTANVFPWPIEGANQITYGFIFLGAACYFIYANLVPVWGNAQGQLAGFLAYDLVLIVPYLQHFAKVPDALRPNLIIYTAVLIYSGLLAIYYLFLHPTLRLGSKG